MSEIGGSGGDLDSPAFTTSDIWLSERGRGLFGRSGEIPVNRTVFSDSFGRQQHIGGMREALGATQSFSVFNR